MKKLFLLGFLISSALSWAIKPVPSDPKATPATVRLFQKMLKLEQKGIMFGHQDAFAYGVNWYNQEGRSDVKEVCGDHPAVIGWELGNLELGDAYSLDSVYFDNIRKGIQYADKIGAINTISWHHRNAITGGSAWDVSSTKTVAAILPGGEKHALYLQYLDKLANFMLSLKNDKGEFIPVLFRPYHEHTGSWFWWGKNLCTVDQYKALWRFTVNYLRNEKNIHHLLFSYSTDRFATKDEYLERYPGDDIIDLVGFDLYDRGPEYPEVLGNCAKVVTQIATEKGKIAAVTEVGDTSGKKTEWWTKTILETLRPYNLSYVLVWRNAFTKTDVPFGPYKGSPSEQDFVKFYNDPKTLFLNDIK